ncbi:spindle and kinetochore-associated protein 1-like [Linepithema humile]|uniref:spindle and kinetochore-associated protein 1-like n=1 Tax=Linepithema humile TaxID=83485 RepID=UPI0006234E47|nr:PREDICTED: uncharacterized protein LOC105677398 [Linepithema humile]XP_012231422.1 PREDICTED: uncharacterized protein LOC105677398 [Linepithema humile]XP_012231423.1 PREDICTED: uncharacterized protein LOC105677398 [Linepithema humile]
MSVYKKDNKDDLEEIIDEQCKRMLELRIVTELIKSKHNIKDELQTIHQKMLQKSNDVENLRKDLDRIKAQNVYLKELCSLTAALDKKIVDEEAYVPSELLQAYQDVNKKSHLSAVKSSSQKAQTIFFPARSDSNVNSAHLAHQLIELKTPSYYNSNVAKQSMVKDCKRTLFQSESDMEVCPTIPLITIEEFNKLPKYMIGRQTLETINSLINTINQTLIAKYTILSLGKAGAQKKGEINLYLQYKKQEFDIEEQKGYLYFFTAEDYYRQTKTKIDKTKLNLITALRHCKRLREYRIKNELRYVIMSN